MAGNLTSRADNTETVTESFTYDALNRVSTGTIAGGVAKSFTYDAIGDIVTKSDVGGTYMYPASGAGSVRPHGVTSISGGTVNNGDYGDSLLLVKG